MALNLIKKGLPLGAGPAIRHQEIGAIFMSEIFAIRVADALPVLVRDNMTEGDVMLAHEVSGEASGAVKGSSTRVSTIFAHFDAD